MRKLPSYKSIFLLSFPIMLGSAAQNVIALSDSIFLFHLSSQDFAAIGFVSTFYLVINAIGFGFSKGGQIIIARRFGERNYSQVGATFRSLFLFEILLAIAMFLLLRYGSEYLFLMWAQSELIYTKSMEYLVHRSWGVFFAYSGLCMIALYMGIARPRFIIYNTLVLGAFNILLDYILIFGKWGFPAMGIRGAGLASSLAEALGVLIFMVYMVKDRRIYPMKILDFANVQLRLVRDNLRISMPIVIQYGVSVGSWFLFFLLIEKMGERPLAISNLGRVVFLLLSIPCWGYSSGINTIVSNFISKDKKDDVIAVIWKTSWLSLISTVCISLPLVLFPEKLLYPLFFDADLSLIHESRAIFYVIMGILVCFSISSIFFNGLSGTGATFYALIMQIIASVMYIILLFIFVVFLELRLELIWTSEIYYWAIIFFLSYLYLRSKKWESARV